MTTAANKTLTRRGLGLLAALAVHGLGLLLWWQAQGPRLQGVLSEATRLTVNLIAVAPMPPTARQAAPAPKPPQHRDLSPPPLAISEQPAVLDLGQEPLQSEAPTRATLEAGAAQTTAPPSSISPESIQRAIQAHLAQAPPRPDRGTRTTSAERFGQDVAQAAVGDCLKGEFFGGGSGLLSAPFWLLAEARGKCRR